jgi:hypothetical protein
MASFARTLGPCGLGCVFSTYVFRLLHRTSLLWEPPRKVLMTVTSVVAADVPGTSSTVKFMSSPISLRSNSAIGEYVNVRADTSPIGQLCK